LSWVNNLFDRVLILIRPSYSPSVNIDMPVQVSNNLFHGGRLNPYPTGTSAGDWAFKDNLFDQVLFACDPTLPLDHNFNA